MEAWRQWLLGGEKNLVQKEQQRIHLTPTGLLMEGDYTQNPCRTVVGEIGILRHLVKLQAG
jgi:hypothetical protein